MKTDTDMFVNTESLIQQTFCLTVTGGRVREAWGLWRHPRLSHWARQHCKIRDWNAWLGVSLTDSNWFFFFLSSTRLQFLDINTIYWKVTYSINFVNKIDTKKRNICDDPRQEGQSLKQYKLSFKTSKHLSLILKKGVCQRWVASSFMSSFLLQSSNSFLLDDVSQHRVAVLRPLEVRKKSSTSKHNPESVLTHKALENNPFLWVYFLNFHAECGLYLHTVSNVAENSLECALVTKTVQQFFFFLCYGGAKLENCWNLAVFRHIQNQCFSLGKMCHSKVNICNMQRNAEIDRPEFLAANRCLFSNEKTDHVELLPD